MIDVKDLTKTYGDHQVLKGINEHIHKGEKVAIIGPSGSGKSTFLRCLNLLEEPTSGTITFEGVDITDPKNDINKLRARMGMVFQQFNLFPHMTVKQNITLAPTKLKLMTKAQADKKALELLERVGLPDKANAYPKQLSGGQQQRIAIARALAMNHGGGHPRDGLCPQRGHPGAVYGRGRHRRAERARGLLHPPPEPPAAGVPLQGAVRLGGLFQSPA